MKIAILSAYSGKYQRGVENWAEQFKKNLPQHKVDIISVVNNNTPCNWQTPISNNSIYKRLFIDYWSLYVLRFTFKALPKILESKYDIVIPTNGGWQSLIIRLTGIIAGYKTVIFSHSGIGWDDRFNLMVFPDTFVALSKVAANWAKTVNPNVNVVHIPLGVDTSKFSPIGRKVIIKLPAPILLCAAAAIPSKNIDKVITAISKVPRVSLLVLSSGPQERQLDELASELLPNRYLRLTVPHDDMPNYYRAVNAFVFTPWARESYPTVYLEALASNLPIIASDDPIRREMIGNAGLYIDPTQTDQFAKTISTLLSKKWHDIPRQQSLSHSWSEIAVKYDELFTSLIKHVK